MFDDGEPVHFPDIRKLVPTLPLSERAHFMKWNVCQSELSCLDDQQLILMIVPV